MRKILLLLPRNGFQESYRRSLDRYHGNHIQLSDGGVIRRHVDSVRSRSVVSDQPGENPEQGSENISPALQGVGAEPENPEPARA